MDKEKRACLSVGIILGILLVLSLLGDEAIIKVVSILRNSLFNAVAVALARINRLYILLLVAFLLLKRRALLRQWPLVYVLGSAAAFVGKHLIQRPRPFEVSAIANLIPEDGFSFPSGHATVLFTAFPILVRAMPKYRWLILIIFLLLILSRVYVGVHYASDVFAGALLGLLVSCATMKLAGHSRFFHEPRK